MKIDKVTRIIFDHKLKTKTINQPVEEKTEETPSLLPLFFSEMKKFRDKEANKLVEQTDPEILKNVGKERAYNIAIEILEEEISDQLILQDLLKDPALSPYLKVNMEL